MDSAHTTISFEPTRSQAIDLAIDTALYEIECGGTPDDISAALYVVQCLIDSRDSVAKVNAVTMAENSPLWQRTVGVLRTLER